LRDAAAFGVWRDDGIRGEVTELLVLRHKLFDVGKPAILCYHGGGRCRRLHRLQGSAGIGAASDGAYRWSRTSDRSVSCAARNCARRTP